MNQSVINTTGQSTSTQSTSTLMDLVFNPETGDFEQRPRGTANEGDTVTKMTEDGFAATNYTSAEHISPKDNLPIPPTIIEEGPFGNTPERELAQMIKDGFA